MKKIVIQNELQIAIEQPPLPPSWAAVVESIVASVAAARRAAADSAAHGGPAAVSRPPVIFVTGAKGTGKSTFARSLANALLADAIAAAAGAAAADVADFGAGAGDAVLGGAVVKISSGWESGLPAHAPVVGWLDLDPGQPEHGPPGGLGLAAIVAPILGAPESRAHAWAPPLPPCAVPVISAAVAPQVYAIRGSDDDPPKTLPLGAAAFLATDAKARAALPVHFAFLGASSVRDAGASAFNAAVRALGAARDANARLSAAPLVVNAHGWVEGAGAASLVVARRVLAPTHEVVLVAGGGDGGAGQGGSGRGPGGHARGGGPFPVEIDGYSVGGVRADVGASYEPPVVAMLPAWWLAVSATPDRFVDKHFSVEAQDAWADGGKDDDEEDDGAGADDDGEDGSAAEEIGTRDERADGDIGAGSGVAAAHVASHSLTRQRQPRAARSPAELRAARMLPYLLGGLTFPDGEQLLARYRSELRSRTTLRTALPGDRIVFRRGEDSDEVDDDGSVFGSVCDGHDDNFVDEGSASAGDDRPRLRDDVLQLTLSQHRDANSSALGSTVTPAISPSVVHAATALWAAAHSTGTQTLAAVLGGARAGRAPSRGLGSPAWLVRAALPARVAPGALFALPLSASDFVRIDVASSACGDTAAAVVEREARAAVLVGSLVGIVCGARDAASTATSVAAAAEVARASSVEAASNAAARSTSYEYAAPALDFEFGTSVGAADYSASAATASVAEAAAADEDVSLPLSALPCVGIALVRGYDARARVLHLITPVSRDVLERADALVAWAGSAREVPPALLAGGPPEGDPFCAAARALERDSAGARDGASRRNLKRRRLAGSGTGERD